jgi:predicted SnoaL-like aldol condensation-catalyzing enzyme
MRKIFFLFLVAAISLLSACNEKASTTSGEMSDAAKKNLDAFHAVDKAFQTGDISQIDSVVASDFLDHTPKGDIRGTDSLKAMITRMKNAGTMKSEVKKEFADDEYVMAWLRWTGTLNVPMDGMPAGPFDMSGIEVVRFKDGKAVEHWAFMDPAEMMKMMGNMQPPPSTATPTSTDKQ